MPATNIAVQTPVGPYPTLPVSANALDIAMTAADAANGNDFICTGRELLIARNSGAGARTITITSVADDLNRTGNVTTYSIGAGEYMAFWFGNTKGWADGSSKVTVQAEHAEVLLGILTIPRN